MNKIKEIFNLQKPFREWVNICRHKEGYSVVLEDSGVPFFSDDGVFLGYRGITRDITVKKAMELEQAQRKKLEGALAMAGAVCHELNQPMMAISGYAEIVSLDPGLAPSIREKIFKILHQVTRMGDITRKLMNITRYETKPYADGHNIMDIHKASDV